MNIIEALKELDKLYNENLIDIEKIDEDNWEIAKTFEDKLQKFHNEPIYDNKHIKQYINNNDDKGFIIYCNDKPAGYFTIDLYMDGVKLGNIYVDKNFRGNGIASYIIEQFIENNLDTPKYIFVKEWNTKALELYKNHGFEEVARFPKFESIKLKYKED